VSVAVMRSSVEAWCAGPLRTPFDKLRETSLFSNGVSLLTSGQAIRSYCTGISHRPVSAAILNANHNKKTACEDTGGGEKFHF